MNDRQFESVLDRCLMTLQSGRATMEEIVARHPEHAQRLIPLLKAAQRAASISGPWLSDDAVTAIQGRLLQRAGELRTRTEHHRPVALWGRFRLMPVALVLLVALLMSGVWVSSAAAASLPGDVLYPLKRVTERVQLALTFSEMNRLWLHIQFAERRLAEVQAVLERRGQLAEVTLAEVGDETEAALASVEQLDSDQVEMLTTLAALTERQQAVLTAVQDKAPPQAQAGLSRAMERSRRGHERAQAMLEKGGKGDQTLTPHPTRTPEPSRTPKPTHTPKATHTPKPTQVPKPAHTPRPTHTPKPAHEPKPTNVPGGPPRDVPLSPTAHSPGGAGH